MSLPTPAFYVGRVMHKRLRPFVHRFDYRVFSALLELDVPIRCRWFSYAQWNILSFYERDHGRRDGSPLRPWVEAELKKAGLYEPGLRVFLLCYPRLWGFVFNPLSVYYCYRADGALHAVIHEVKNTFGGQHSYVMAGARQQACPKLFYVSPFLATSGGYRFALLPPGEKVSIVIHQGDEGGDNLVATFTGQRRPFTDLTILKLVLTHPLMTLKVVAAIHWQALWIWLKGAKYHAPPPPTTTSSAHTGSDEVVRSHDPVA